MNHVALTLEFGGKIHLFVSLVAAGNRRTRENMQT
jgi:hypothetical protein